MRRICELWLVLGFVSCGSHDAIAPAAKPIRVFAAASLTPIVQHLANQRPSELASLQLNFAATSTLARQIDSGAKADVFLSAHTEWIDWLKERDLVEPDSLHDFASGELVWIVRADALNVEPFALNPNTDLPSHLAGLLAIGDPAHVPVGRYAKQALQNLNAWDVLSDRVLSTVDAPAAVRLVELGEASAAIVYASDAQLSKHIAIRARFPIALSQSIRYQAVLLRGAHSSAQTFIDQLLSPASVASLEAYGFQPAKP
ncbi:MAG: molybdate transport system substrate-binding protein [Planctomycetota bacterium]|jgi:molybdate transport system substrate-binding protein